MNDPVETSVRRFYDEHGWKEGHEGKLFRVFRPAYRPYDEAANQRALACFDGREGHLLIAGCGDLPPSHKALAERFQSVSCLDISPVALTIAGSKLPQAKMVLGSICEAPFPSDSFDAVFAAHVIYHIDANLQERAVRELIRVTRKGGRIVILYGNPQSPIQHLARAMLRLRKLVRGENVTQTSAGALYCAMHPLAWWDRFVGPCQRTMLPWEIVGSIEERALIPSDGLAALFYRLAQTIESRFPRQAVRLWQHAIIILDKIA